MTAGRRMVGPLTARQIEVLTLVANGNSAVDIGRWLWIEPCSVQTVLRNAYRALGVNDRAHAAAVAIRLGLISLDDVHVPAALSASLGRDLASVGPGVRGAAAGPSELIRRPESRAS